MASITTVFAAAESGATATGRASGRPRLVESRLKSKAGLISPSVLAGLLRAIEFVALAASGLSLAFAYVGSETVMADLQYWLAAIVTSAVTVLGLDVLRLYAGANLHSVLRQIPRVAIAWSIAMGLLMVAVVFFKSNVDFSRGWIALWFAVGGGLLIASRFIVSTMARRWARQGRLNRRAVIYGSGAHCESLLKALEADPNSDIRICGIFDDRGTDRTSTVIAGYPKLGNIDELIAFSQQTRVDMLIVSLPITAEERLLQILRRLWVMPVDIRLAAHTGRLRFRPRTYSYVGTVPMIDLFDKPITDWGVVSKWIFDKAIALLALVVLAPLMAIVAALIKLDSKGPVFFKQKRYGFNNELIEVFKFRSMYTDKSDATASKLVTKDDPRVTPIGRIIRKTSIDELPQLFNVLNGTLSLVGPRPHAVQAKAADQLYQDVVDGYFARHKVKPGITGWAQINGWRGETDTADKIENRVKHDLYYIENWSVLFDFYILIKTPMSLLKTENAY